MIEFNGTAVGYERVSLTGPETVAEIEHNPGTTGIVGAIDPAFSETKSSSGNIFRTRDTRLKLKYFGQDLSVAALLQTEETTDGRLLGWKLNRTAADQKQIRRTGRWSANDGGYELTEVRQGTTSRRLLTLPAPASSPLVEAWTSSLHLRERASSTAAVLFPESESVRTVDIRCQGAQSIHDQGRQVAVARYEWSARDQAGQQSTYYLDESGAVILMQQPLFDSRLTFRRTLPDVALQAAGIQTFDLDLKTLLRINRPIENVASRTQTRIQLVPEAGSELHVASGDFQAVEQARGRTLLVTLTRPDLNVDARQFAVSPVSLLNDPQLRPYLTASPLVDLADPDVQRQARLAGGSSSDPVQIALHLRNDLARHLRYRDFSASIESASTTAQTMRGDCTAHAVLLCAMLRVHRIPARVAVGLVYVERIGAFTSHMWVEAKLNDRWVPFDSSTNAQQTGSTGVGCTHLKIADSSLADASGNGISLFLPLLDVLSGTQLKLQNDLVPGQPTNEQ
ncbi:MAG: transglutaminase domain-containing protein [Planctomycetaceae bacterium]|nr:transglutaminase domain-containing protein [Planctomycetaceae bacterium]